MLRKIIWLVASAMLFTTPALADVPTWSVVKEKSSLKFFAIENGAPVEGRFTDFDAAIHFSPDDLDHSSIEATVKTGSIEVANEDVSKNIRLPDWLSADAFPTAVFKCSKLTRMPTTNNYYAPGTLTLRGKTMPVTLNFQLDSVDSNNVIATGYITVFRNQFGVGQGQWAGDDVVKNEVRVEFRIVAQKK